MKRIKKKNENEHKVRKEREGRCENQSLDAFWLCGTCLSPTKGESESGQEKQEGQKVSGCKVWRRVLAQGLGRSTLLVVVVVLCWPAAIPSVRCRASLALSFYLILALHNDPSPVRAEYTR